MRMFQGRAILFVFLLGGLFCGINTAFASRSSDAVQDLLQTFQNRRAAREAEAKMLGITLPSSAEGFSIKEFDMKEYRRSSKSVAIDTVTGDASCEDTFASKVQAGCESCDEDKIEAKIEDEAEAEASPVLMPLPKGLDLWQNERLRSAEKGWEYEFSYTGEYIRVLNNYGQKKKSVYLDNLSLSLDIDLEKAGIARNGNFFVSMLGNSGGNITGDHLDNSGIGRIGDLQVVSNIEANESFRLYEFFFEKPFGRGKLLLGLRDMNADFYASEFGGFFTNSSFGIGPDVAQNATVSIFNVTAPTIRFSYQLNDDLMVQCALIDGNPGSADDNRNGLGLRVSSDEGFFGIVEAQYTQRFLGKDLDGTLKLGTWKHSGKFDDVINTDAAGNPVVRDGNWGTYAVVDQKLWVRKSNPDSHIGGFIQVGGLNPTDRSGIEKYYGGGLVFNGPFAERPQDCFGIAINMAETNSRTRDFNVASGQTGLTKERVLEADYSYQVNDWLTVKPYLQVIKNVGGDPGRDQTRVFGLRFNSLF